MSGGYDEIFFFVHLFFGLILIGLLFVCSALLWPLVGSIMRYRAHYKPKELDPDERDDLDSMDVGGAATLLERSRFWRCLVRIRRLEGWKGFYKGIGPFAVYGLYLLLILIPIVPIAGILHGVIGFNFIFGCMLFALLVACLLVTYPFRVLVIRSIAQPSSNLYLSPRRAFVGLMNESERRDVLKLYFLPGLTLSFFLQDIGQFIVLLMQYVVSVYASAVRSSPLNSSWGLVARFVWQVTVSILLCPLEVISVRLALQRYGIFSTGSPEATIQSPPAAHEETDLIGVRYESDSENVIIPRTATNREPYTGFFDCAKSIIREEGWSTLWRGWYIWAIFLMIVGPIFSSVMS